MLARKAIAILLLVGLLGCNANETEISKETEHSTLVSEKQADSDTFVDIPLPDSLPKLKFTSMVRSILQDSKGNLWFGSDKEGVARFDGERFTYFTIEEDLSHNQIRTIQEDEHGHIWFATGYGLSKFDGENMSVEKVDDYQPVRDASMHKWPETLLHKAAETAEKPLVKPEDWTKKPGDLWFNGEVEGGLYRYDGQELSILAFPVLPANHESFSISGTVTGLSDGKSGILWIANYNGLIGYDGERFHYINQRNIMYHIRDVFEDSKGRLWIANNGIGVLLYDGATTINFSEKMGASNRTIFGLDSKMIPDSLRHVFAIEEAADGAVWFGDRDAGAWRFDGETLTQYTLKDGLTGMFVGEIYRDKQDRLWFGTENGGVCLFDGNSFKKVF